MVPFLFTDLSRTLLNLAERFMKAECLQKLSSLTIEAVNETKNHLPAKKIVVGFDAVKLLNNNTRDIKEKDILQFKDECRTFLKTIVTKLLSRSPLTYSLTRACSAIDPQTIASDKKVAERRMEKLLSILSINGRVSGVCADATNRQYRKVILQSSSFDTYDRKQTRVDVFWRDFLKDDHKELLRVVQMVCCLSHGNSNVERGFSINSECLFENMKEESLVARRLVYDAVCDKGGIEKVAITKSLLLRARNTHSLFVESKERRKKEELADQQNSLLKKKRDAEAKELQAKRAKLLEDAQREAEQLQEKINMLKN